MTNNALGVAGVAFGAKVQPVRVLGAWRRLHLRHRRRHHVGFGRHRGRRARQRRRRPKCSTSAWAATARAATIPATQAAIDWRDRARRDRRGRGRQRQRRCGEPLAGQLQGRDHGRRHRRRRRAFLLLQLRPHRRHLRAGRQRHQRQRCRTIAGSGRSATAASTAPDPEPGGDAMMGMIGTSMASPHVAGIVALMQSRGGRRRRVAADAGAGEDRCCAPPRRRSPCMPPSQPAQGAGIANAAAAVLAATGRISRPTSDTAVQPRGDHRPGRRRGRRDDVSSIVVPAGRTSVNLRTYGGTGNVSLYVARDRMPTASELRSQVGQGRQQRRRCVITNPAAGTYYMTRRRRDRVRQRVGDGRVLTPFDGCAARISSRAFDHFAEYRTVTPNSRPGCG